MRIVCVAAHPDDEVLGCGGTLAKHAAAGHDCHVLFMGAGRGGIEAGTKACEILGAKCWALNYADQCLDVPSRLEITRELEETLELIGSPDIVYTHHKGDLNLDHRITHEVVLTALRPCASKVKAIYGFEVPSSTEWGLEPFWPTRFVDVSGEPYAKKAKAIECYQNEMRDFPHPRSTLSIDSLSLWRGATAGLHRAEAFTVIRQIA